MGESFSDFLADLFAPLGGVTIRRMFGGAGIFRDGVMFGLVSDDVLYLRSDDAGAAAFEDEGCGPFVYDAKGKPMRMPYWRVPERLFDDPEEFRDWAVRAFATAERLKARPKPPKDDSAQQKAGRSRSGRVPS